MGGERLNAATAGSEVPEWLRQRSALTPGRLALISVDERLTFADLDRDVDYAAERLDRLGLKRGDVASVLAANSGAFVKVVYAIARLGAVLLPLNTRLTPDELALQLRDTDARFLIYDAQNANTAATLRPELPGLQLVPVNELIDSSTEPELTRPSVLAAEQKDLTALQGIVYTSGTTGRPKGALLTFSNHFWSAVGSALNLGLQPDDRWLACLPLFHVGGLAILFRGVIYGIPVIVHESFDAERVNRAIDEEGVTIVSVVSAMLQQLLDARGGAPYPPTLRCVLLGGGPAPEPLLRRCAELGVPVVQTYGLTETASQVATLAPDEALTRLGSAGKPLFPVEVRICREDGSACAPGEAGEIRVRGPVVSPGYLNQPGASRAVTGTWLHTGDIGYLDGEGYLYVLDRRDDLIVSGGENVYPAEVEGVLQDHPAVAAAGVFGVADERWGNVPVAVVVLQPDAETSAEALLAFCRERLAAYKAPARISFAPALPRNAAGKLLRNELKVRAASSQR